MSLLRISALAAALLSATAYDVESAMDACDEPTTVNSGSVTSVNLTEDSWTFYNINVNESVTMHSLRYRLSSESNNASDIQVAFLVGRCLEEVEDGTCPPRCSTLTDSDRVPQYCTIPEYCPGCEQLDEVSCTNKWVSTDELDSWAAEYLETTTADEVLTFGNTAGYSGFHYVDRWVDLKLEGEADADFYFGIFGMEVPGDSMMVDLWIEADAYSSAAFPAISIFVLLCVVFVTLV